MLSDKEGDRDGSDAMIQLQTKESPGPLAAQEAERKARNRFSPGALTANVALPTP